MAKGKDTVDLKITSAVMIGGKMIRPGKGKASEITVTNAVGRDLLHRGKATLLTAETASEEKPADEKGGDKKPVEQKGGDKKPADEKDGKTAEG